MTDTQDPDTVAQPTTDPERHAVLQYQLQPMTDWYSWRLRWDNPDAFPEERLGLLHCAFNIRCQQAQDAADRLCLLLDLADGDPRGRFIIHDHQDRQAQESYTQLVDKAKTVLAEHYFKMGDNPQTGEPYWLPQVELPGVLQKTIWFFRPNRFGNVDNLQRIGRKHHITAATEQFASALWKLCWDYKHIKVDGKGRSRSLNPSEQQFFELLVASRAQLLHLALVLDDADTLVNNPRYLLDDACRQYLRGIALKPKYHEGKQITPDSLEQAFFLGSRAAKVLILNDIADRECARLEEIKLALRLARENEARLAELRRGPGASTDPGALLRHGTQTS